jgi:SET domain-containing protein
MNTTNEFSFVLKPSKFGVGVFAAHDIKKGTVLRLFGDSDPTRKLKREEVPERFKHFCPDYGDFLLCPPDFGYMPIGWYLNHSESPTALQDSQKSGTYGMHLTAAHDISEDEEITIDYNCLQEPEGCRETFYRKDKSSS